MEREQAVRWSISSRGSVESREGKEEKRNPIRWGRRLLCGWGLRLRECLERGVQGFCGDLGKNKPSGTVRSFLENLGGMSGDTLKE